MTAKRNPLKPRPSPHAQRTPSPATQKAAPLAGNRLLKRSVSIAGHATSVSLEDIFWDELRRIAAYRGLSIAALIAHVDGMRGEANLSSALRIHVLETLREERRVQPSTNQNSAYSPEHFF